MHYLGQAPRQPYGTLPRFPGMVPTGPNVAICKADLLDTVATQGIYASSHVFADENSDGGRLGIKCKERADILWSRE